MNVSIVVPTLNEGQNICTLVQRIADALKQSPLVDKSEIVVVDDGSTDDTIAKLTTTTFPIPVVTIQRAERGLATAVIRGFTESHYEVVGVIDADLSHPPEIIPKMLESLNESDIVVGSRNMPGGAVESWPWYRKLSSQFASLLTRPIGIKNTDPMSGYFFLRKKLLDGVTLNPVGYKILLEILVKCPIKKCTEIPYTFSNRFFGKSKMGARESFNYLRHISRLYFYKLTHTSFGFDKVYSAVALAIFNTLLLLVLLNLLLAVFFNYKDSHSKANPVIKKYGLDMVRQAYPGVPDSEIIALLGETWSRTQVFDAFTVFRERPTTGAFVTVTPTGYRPIAEQAEWPPRKSDFVIFVFGGSTTFGYGVPDTQTIPSYLQQELRKNGYPNVAVYNFGQGQYFSAQERVLFEKLLVTGHVPNMAIFIDGLNEFHPNGEPVVADTAEQIANGNYWPLIYPQLPMGRALISLQQRMAARVTSAKLTTADPAENPVFSDSQTVESILSVYKTNKTITESIANNFGVKTLFVWQPVPLYKADIQKNVFGKIASSDNGSQTYSKYTYPAFATWLQSNSLGSNFLWLADMQESMDGQLYVDSVHYSAVMTEAIADTVAQFVQPLIKSKK